MVVVTLKIREPGVDIRSAAFVNRHARDAFRSPALAVGGGPSGPRAPDTVSLFQDLIH